MAGKMRGRRKRLHSAAAPMPHRTLVSAAELAARLSDADWLVVDCRAELSDTSAGERAWRAGHIPGAIHAELSRDLSAPVTPMTGRHPLPSPAAAAATFSRFGIGERTQVVAYDAGNGAYASRLWWMLRWLGHDAAAVLDGGFAAWVAAGKPVATDSAARAPARFVPRPRPEMLCDAPGVARALGRGEAVVDVRGEPRFRGEVEPIDAIAGHVPGAINRFFERNLGPDGRFLPRERLAAEWRERLGGAPGIVCMCGSGVTACQGLLALEIAGIGGARLYAGSWSEWIRDPERPIARGG